jgi:hypothetical protein
MQKKTSSSEIPLQIPMWQIFLAKKRPVAFNTNVKMPQNENFKEGQACKIMQII